jgi:hypothetical protein
MAEISLLESMTITSFLALPIILEVASGTVLPRFVFDAYQDNPKKAYQTGAGSSSVQGLLH